MILKNIEDVPYEEVTMEGVEKTQIQWIYSEKDGAPNFAMRRFTLAPGGKIPLHGHPWEHEIYFLKGKAEVFTDKERVTVSGGDTIYVPGDELHGYDNTGEEDLQFICMVPIIEQS